MRFLAAGFAVAGVAGALVAPPAPSRVSFFVTGDLRGHLAPCGCTTPQMGGLVRRAAAIRSQAPRDRSVVLDVGGWVADAGLQSEMKARAVAATIATGPPAVVLPTADLRALGVNLDSLKALSNAAWLGGKPVERGGLTVDNSGGKADVLLVDGGRKEALSHRNRLVVYRGPGTPERVGRSWYVPSGERGKVLTRIDVVDGVVQTPVVTSLGPEIPDDRLGARLYDEYLMEVARADLLAGVPREVGPEFAGDPSCTSCHAESAKIHEASAHAHALETLEKKRHDRDPDCVSCHVTGLESTRGFVSRALTPRLARVGCESCHGPSKAHVLRPETRTPGDARKACATCHTPDNSPSFKFSTYWGKIAHGSGKTRG